MTIAGNYERCDCRLCGGTLTQRLELTPTPPANAFAATPDTEAERYPLGLKQCDDCGHVQIGYVLDGAALYTGYKYATPEAMRPHLEQCAADLRKAYPEAEMVIEIGSNNGMNADILRGHFEHVVEVDPGGSTELCFKTPFNASLAETMRGADLVVANHVLAHIDNLDEIFSGINICLKDTGALVFEVQYLPSLMNACAFDMIYHEHRDYHTLRPLARFAKKHGMTLTEWVILPEIQGGSIRVTMRKGKHAEAWMPEERLDWLHFRAGILRAIDDIQRQTPDGVLVFGAAAKACTLLHHAGIIDRVRYAVDDTPAKQGCYIPGTRIKILATDTLYESKSAKTLFMTAWNYEDAIKRKHPTLDFIVPFRGAVKVAA